jgi:acyl-CoA synthetase (AMP-forming)/AMP-acid ligase II
MANEAACRINIHRDRVLRDQHSGFSAQIKDNSGVAALSRPLRTLILWRRTFAHNMGASVVATHGRVAFSLAESNPVRLDRTLRGIGTNGSGNSEYLATALAEYPPVPLRVDDHEQPAQGACYTTRPMPPQTHSTTSMPCTNAARTSLSSGWSIPIYRATPAPASREMGDTTTATDTSMSWGRTDDIINVAAHRLSTGEMEEVLASHPAVAECARHRCP